MAYCNFCGRLIPETKQPDWDHFRRAHCDECAFDRAKYTRAFFYHQIELFCEVCGKPLPHGSGGGKWARRRYCPECKPLSYVKRHPDRAKAQRTALYHKDRLIVLHECPHHERKKVNHHPDYSKPFEVHKLCAQCHVAAHEFLKNQEWNERIRRRKEIEAILF